MIFSKNGEFLSVSRITGPKHNLLQVKISNGDQQPPECTCLPPQGNCKHDPLDEKGLIAHVIDGIKTVNEELNTNYCVTHIRYVENDTKPEVVYGAMIIHLIRHLETGGEFLQGKNV